MVKVLIKNFFDADACQMHWYWYASMFYTVVGLGISDFIWVSARSVLAFYYLKCHNNT
jgi:hypothetical protein